MYRNRQVLVLVTLLVCSGCHLGVCAKRESELSCPTDIRQKVPWCAGEDALFHCPCGPSQDFHGYKPTCWRDWSVPGAVWRDARCGPTYSAMPIEGEIIVPMQDGSSPSGEPIPGDGQPEMQQELREDMPLPPGEALEQQPIETTSLKVPLPQFHSRSRLGRQQLLAITSCDFVR